ncbi:MAG: type II CRISPR-associated endonuclease Cas1 [Flavobacteriaceae bacterium]|nr:type II CRISPR-associated endonuclease Cas1 [Flavobacteriaceae bacterium]
MIKRTLFFTNPAYLSTKNQQLVISYPEDSQPTKTVPLEDIGVLVLEHQQITITNGLLAKLVQHKAAIIGCDAYHLPNSFLQPLVGHSEQTERFKHQLNASVPLKKNMWQQTVSAKIVNQALHLEQHNTPARKLFKWAQEVKSGDIENHESRAAVYYWQHILAINNFNRGQHGSPPNHLLNYGYAILRAITARALVSSGMLPSVGIFHKNKYNAFCLADDVMEPYRVYVDMLVRQIINQQQDYEQLTTVIKSQLLQLPVVDVVIDGNKSPLMVAMSRTTNSVYECFAGISRKLLYPVLE